MVPKVAQIWYVPSIQTDHHTHSFPRTSVPNLSCDLKSQTEISLDPPQGIHLKNDNTQYNTHPTHAAVLTGIRIIRC